MLRYLLNRRKKQPPIAHGEACCLLHEREVRTALECANKVDLRIVKSIEDVVDLQVKLRGAMKDKWE